jgi:electron transfer flavoprotein beta subunit
MPQMKRILVGIKRVVDYNVRVRVKPDGSGVATEGRQDEHQPLRRDRARGGAAPEGARATPTRWSSCRLGTADAQAQLRTALAMGADRAMLVDAPEPPSSRSTPRACS